MKTLTFNPVKPTGFGTLEDRQNLLHKKTVKDFINIGTIATAFFIIADYIPLNMKWDAAIQSENKFFVAILAAASAFVLDVPMLLAGRALREYIDGLKTKKSMLIIVILAIAGFLIAYVPFLIFSITTKDATFQEALPLEASTNVFSFDQSTADSNPFSVLMAAIYCAIIPLGTSLSSLIIGITTYHPVEERLKKLEKVKILAEEHKTAMKEGQAQVTERMELIKAREQDLFECFKREVYAQEQIRIQAYEEALEECLDADGILRVTDNAKDLLDDSGFTDSFEPLILNQIDGSVIDESKGMTSLYQTVNSFNTVT